MADEKLKKLGKLIDEKERARKAYDADSTPENKKRAKEKHDEVTRALSDYEAAQGNGRPAQSRKWTE